MAPPGVFRPSRRCLLRAEVPSTLIHQTHRLADTGTSIAGRRGEKPQHILRKPESRRASRELVYGYSVSSKRYVIYERTSDGEIKVIEPKAHGLGYLAAPKEEKEGDEGNWIAEAWDWLLRCELGLKFTAPSWLNIPAMMPIG